MSEFPYLLTLGFQLLLNKYYLILISNLLTMSIKVKQKQVIL